MTETVTIECDEHHLFQHEIKNNVNIDDDTIRVVIFDESHLSNI